jgi:hypothetical protein
MNGTSMKAWKGVPKDIEGRRMLAQHGVLPSLEGRE